MEDEIRRFILLTESLDICQPLVFKPVEIQPEIEDFVEPVEEFVPNYDDEMLQKMEDLIFKLKSYQDPDVGEYSAGVEAGMNRAADMLQNLVNRLREM
jgi:hypothetical protein